VSTTAASTAADQAYEVEILESPEGWGVAVVDRHGVPVFRRACSGGAESRAFASTVRQHLYWLSEATFRAYYRL
jgi:hypothetical protein